MRYELPDRTTRPDYPFLVRSASSPDYLLFDDYERAYECAEGMSEAEDGIVFLYELKRDGTGHDVMAFADMRFASGNGVYAHDDSPLHAKYYLDAGEWLNPPA